MEEIWKDIIDYEGLYQVSNLGNIKRFYIHRSSIIRKPIISTYGYLEIGLSKNRICKIYKIHRLVAKAFIDNPNMFLEVNHIDGNKQNNNINNLEWCTRSMNIKHAFDNGLRVVTKEHKKILSENMSLRTGKKNPNRKSIIDTKTNIVYDTIYEAANSIKMNPSTLSAMLSNRNPNKTSLKYDLNNIK